MQGIVVGVDGSPNSEHALDWAMKAAADQHAALTVIAVHQALRSYWTGNPVTFAGDTAEVEKTRQAAAELVEKATSRLGEARPSSVTVHAVHGLPAKELIDASHGADLIVVGSRGGGGFTRLMLGSVSSQVVQHAVCPVVVIPHDK